MLRSSEGAIDKDLFPNPNIAPGVFMSVYLTFGSRPLLKILD
jgi:hypothetical protein